jgi:paraquat-inducible protein A
MTGNSQDRTARWMPLLTVLYLFITGFAGWEVIQHSNASSRYLKEACERWNLRNEAAQLVARFTIHHLIIGSVFGPSVEQFLHLPTLRQSSQELAVANRLLGLSKQEKAIANPWSWLLLGMSLIYIAAVVAVHDSFRSRHLIFALTCVSIFLFVIGITAPALAILTVPTVPIQSETIEFVLQCEIRSLTSVIVNLFRSGWWLVASLITTFGIVTPLTKIALTLFAITTRKSSARVRVSRFLHAIGKWSMADVFVAAVLLGLFAMKSQQQTRAFPCLGLYFFAGYCLLSMVTTVLLSQPQFVETSETQENRVQDPMVLLERIAAWGLMGIAIAMATVSVVYQYEQTAVQARNPPVMETSAEFSPQRHQFTGVVLSINTQTGTVVVKKGTEGKTFKTSDKTRYSTADKPTGAMLADIEVGDKVLVRYTEEDGVLTAHSIGVPPR